ncbi:hypothetical protein BAUCODRAFT_72261 [Baudoinia panamericana UAMH 10762]|uniref:Zn(2)-C6 fungal-type domain-containing protein n=1 Tax=Baudoinia panamericana (strain UAMH 10762) TaxID=717646 RepID=M2N7Q8_BAUPA|nr:uncharacterized protein BAUCODRAFT_72261 [Baudoinia panamericana UAMH 10762]EMC95104.1 hypothetical protein BAUCODRAFT_72261 [Baudoinia panamericana UAMH 10762]
MTSNTALTPPIPGTEADDIAQPPPRKRRRRTTAGGATEDCFTCRKRSVQCDRKRPYCTQCLDIGKDCSGYKTTLTWGVGVASRGKLRGLHYPIANKNVDGNDTLPESEGATPSLPLTIPQPPSNWQSLSLHQSLPPRRSEYGRQNSFVLPPLHRLQTALGPPYRNPSVPNSGVSIESYAETEFHSPLEYPQTPGSVAFADQTRNPFADQPLGRVTSNPYTPATPPTDAYTDSAGFRRSSNAMDVSTMDPSQSQLSPMDAMFYSNADVALSDLDSFTASVEEMMEDEEQNSLALFDSRFSSPFFHLTPRLQSLLDHYDRCICPYLVAFDGPQNPYRKHILQLAVDNEGLQNAIAALATNNIRMRQKQPQQLGFVEELMDAQSPKDAQDSKQAMIEESMYKQISIDHLNVQLTERGAAHDDSVLATLLILCLFHVCDSGFSKFKTQLAGVQKLLSLRNPTIQSSFTGWVQMFFTWCDVITSTVNDREVQIKGEALDMLDFSANLGGLEQFSGCDGRLFKLIARLGRLNLLAQGRPVKDSNGIVRTPRTSAKRTTTRSGRRMRPSTKLLANKSLSPLDYEHIDGNGWGTPIISSDEDADGTADEGLAATTQDERREFWEDWHDLRNRLQAWQMDASVVPAAHDRTQIDAGYRDLDHINESFRYSALLYTERLASPVLPSSHPQFQTLVSQALYHITALSVTSCVNKFLLWPLFIIGTECVDEGHRNIIRTRCVEIQRESGFFNNLSGLEVLERVWREVGENTQGNEVEEVRVRRRDSEAGRRGARYGQAFRWRKAMDRADGEYIVI